MYDRRDCSADCLGRCVFALASTRRLGDILGGLTVTGTKGAPITESRPFDEAERKRFHNLLLLANESPYEGERTAALAAAKRMSKARGMTLEEAASGGPPPPEPKLSQRQPPFGRLRSAALRRRCIRFGQPRSCPVTASRRRTGDDAPPPPPPRRGHITRRHGPLPLPRRLRPHLRPPAGGHPARQVLWKARARAAGTGRHFG